MSDDDLLLLHELAGVAGISVDWRSAAGHDMRVAPEVLRNVLMAMDLDAATPGRVADSLARLRHEIANEAPVLVTALVRQQIELPGCGEQGSLRFRIEFESGEVADGEAKRRDDSTLTLPGINLPGYHQLSIGGRQLTLAVAPASCYSIADAVGQPSPREWALAVQLYGLRRGGKPGARRGSGGIGDYTALAELAQAMARKGATGIAISPVHAMFSADPGRYSPYGPSSRLFLNVLHIDPAEVFGQPAAALAVSALGLNEELLRLEQRELIDWQGAARAKLAVLRRLFENFPSNVGSRLQDDFVEFRRAGGRTLEDHARFEALHAWHLSHDGGALGWQAWPEGFRHPEGPAVEAFAQRHADEVRFHVFLQWLAARGLSRAQRLAREAGMHIGLIADLAVGTDPSGSHAWSRQDEIFARLSPGAPPDSFNQLGQQWGLTSFAPRALQRHGYRAFIEMLRANLRHAGGIRIDHALGLARMWLVPRGASAAEGAYVRYPFDDMMRLVMLESWRNRAVVIGENLGTVPDGFNERITQAGMLGMEVLWFARQYFGDEAGFRPPRAWPGHSVAMTTTHDLPTVAGWWSGRDLAWRDRLGLFADPGGIPGQKDLRERDKGRLWQAMAEAGVALPEGGPPPSGQAPVEQVLAFVGRTAAPLVIVPIEDAIAQVEQANLPGTIGTHPNWLRRLPVSVDQLPEDPGVMRRLASVHHARKQS